MSAAPSMPEPVRAALREAVSLHQAGRLDDAQARYRAVLAQDPENPFALQFLGTIAAQRAQAAAALELYDRALARYPDYPDAHSNRASALKALGRLEEALAAAERALALDPDYADAHNNRGVVLLELGRREDALGAFDRALQLAPGLAYALVNRGDALRSLGRFDEALASYDRALALDASNADVHYNRGLVLALLGRLGDACASFDRVIALDPRHGKAHNSRGAVLARQKRLDEALEAYARALALNPADADALYNRGLALEDLKRLDEAAASYASALEAAPAYPYLRGTCLHARMQLCEWDGYSGALSELAAAIERGEKAAPPFPAMTLLDVPALQRKAVATWVRDKHPESDALGPLPRRPRPGRIRVGYYSADYHEHASTYLEAEMFESHDRGRFETVAFSFGPDRDDPMRRRCVAAFDRFLDVRGRSDREIAALSREMEIDIAVDLKGFTRDSRAAIFSFRAAPLQVAYMGFPASTAASYMDYLVADHTVIPPEARRHYLEKIVYIPVSYMVNDSRRPMPTGTPSRRALGLPEAAFVYCCFNNNFKITPGVFDGWMRILREVPASVLWLLEDNPSAARNLRAHAQRRGVRAERLVFAPRLPLAEHLERHRAADLFLDTLPCNAHTTASDALWAGLPVLTRIGHSFAGRIAASVVRAVDVPELVVDSQEAYEALAIELARSPERLQRIRGQVDRARRASPLFDGKVFTRHLERAYERMFERHHSGLPPEDIPLGA